MEAANDIGLISYRQVESVSFQRPDGNKIYDDVSLSGPSDYLRLVPIVDPITASNLTFTLTDNLAMEYPGKVTVIGEGEGKNWWCVVFPSLCTSSSMEEFDETATNSGYDKEEISLILKEESRFVVRFKMLELFSELFR